MGIDAKLDKKDEEDEEEPNMEKKEKGKWLNFIIVIQAPLKQPKLALN